MANPAPTINQINAFNATQGTTIDFNIIGGTELVRSNRIYIYDLSDNSLICTHLYISTESIHEFPANTDSSIVYESGKSSADFVNGAQYYAQIQTYTDTAGTQGGSGLSVAKMFWCLVDPTLTITTIPSTISTTSYNVSATYNANTSVVSNIIQQYQFSLYSATGSLLQSSGVVVGSGTQQGTSTTYDISYNFTGLSVGSSYYVVVDVTTTQGMSVSVQSNTFTVSIDTPTLGEATVVNNACDGYISVTSNLSGEYGGSGSGEIVSFETDSENVFTKLQVDLEPIQDLNGYDAPWVGGAGKNLLAINVTPYNANGATISQEGDYVKVVINNATGYPFTKIGELPSSFPAGIYYLKYSQVFSGIDFRIIDRTVSPANIIPPEPSGRITIPSGHNDLLVEIAISGAKAVNGTYIVAPSLTSENIDFQPYSNICPISGHDSASVVVAGANLWSDAFSEYTKPQDYRVHPIDLISGQSYTVSISKVGNTVAGCVLGIVKDGDRYNNFVSPVPWMWLRTDGSIPQATFRYTIDDTWVNPKVVIYCNDESEFNEVFANYKIQLELGSTATDYVPYVPTETITTDLNQTVYDGTLDLVTGVLTVDRAMVTLDGTHPIRWEDWRHFDNNTSAWLYGLDIFPIANSNTIICDKLATVGYADIYSGNVGISRVQTSTTYSFGVRVPVGGLTTISAINTYLSQNPLTVVYELATPQTYQLTPQQIQTLVGQNNVWSNAGDVELSYHIPITNLLVKRQDVGDVSGDWLTLYSQPITQASDMDFTFIDFTNQYGKTYKYALVPLLTQTQSGVEVEVEGGYTVSDEVQSVFDGVFIADSTGSQKCKANVGYGNVDMNQVVGSITPIGAKYPIVITNSQNQYHNGSISGTIVPDDYYFNGNLSRIDMVNKRSELEQFLTNKRAKIIKDWNGNIWLVMIMDNVSCTFNNNYGMGIVNFNTNWVEVGDPTNQQDLQATGLINVGGV